MEKPEQSKISEKSESSVNRSVKKTVILLSILLVFMSLFTVALIPFYNVFCKVTGINGKIELNNNTGTLARYKIEREDNDSISKRFITIEFDANRNRDLPCEFTPNEVALQIHPGELALTSYTVKNLTHKKLVIQAIPSISPGIAAKYLKKLECFCFNRQVLKPYEIAKLPLRFWIEPEIPDNVHRLTLSYTLFDVTEI